MEKHCPRENAFLTGLHCERVDHAPHNDIFAFAVSSLLAAGSEPIPTALPKPNPKLDQ